MYDLTLYAVHDKPARLLPSSASPGVWTWVPAWVLYRADLATVEALVSAGWERGGLLDDTAAALGVLHGQLADLGIVQPPGVAIEQQELWALAEDIRRVERLPVMLAFTLLEKQAKQADKDGIVWSRQAIPPANFGEIGLIASGNNASARWIRCPITKLPLKSQQLQHRMGAAITRLASARNLERWAWLEQWREIQAMARQLAADYWRTYQDSQVERPKPINIWTLHQGEAALAAMTMVQAGAHASINNKDKWEREHMIHEGKHQGLVVGRYVHRSDHTETEYWMQHPEEIEAPIDPELVSQEVLRQQAKLDDLECDLSNLAPVYLLASEQERAYISPEQIAKDLGYAAKHNSAGYGNSPQADELRRIKEAFERLAWLRIKTNQSIQKRRGVKPSLITDEAPYLIIRAWKWQEPLDGFGPRQFLGWEYEITWLKKFTGDTEAGKQLGVLLKKSFAYSGKQRWEKKLARYLTLHLNVAAHHGQSSINRIIRNVLEQCGLAPTEHDKARPGEYAQQFERAMDNLKRDGIIGDWKPKLDRHAKDFPTRAWLDLWLDSSFSATQAPTALEAGYQKMIDTRQSKK